MGVGNIQKKIMIFAILVIALLTISTVNATDSINNDTVDDVIICESHDDGLQANDIEDVSKDNINKNSVKDNPIEASNSKNNNANTKLLKSIKDSNTISYTVNTENEVTVMDYNDLYNAVKWFNDDKRVGTITLEGNAIYSVSTSNEITIDSSITINGNGRTIQGFRSQSSENVIHVLKGNTVTIFNLTFNDNVPKQYGIINNEGNLTLKNIKVTNSSGRNAIAIYNEGNIELNESIFENLHYNNGYSYMQGGAIHIHKGAANITNCNFTNCSTIMGGGAISIANYDDDGGRPIVLINKSIFKNNIASGDYECGGAIRIAKSDVTIISCDFINNTALKFGGAIIIDDKPRQSSKVNMVGNSFSDNHANIAGAVFIWYNDNTVIDGNTFNDNYAEGWGGTFYVFNSEITLTNNNVYGGYATVADFFCNDNSTIKSENNTISGFHSTSSMVLYNCGVFNSTNDTIKNCFNDFIIYNTEESSEGYIQVELYLQNGTIVNNGLIKLSYSIMALHHCIIITFLIIMLEM